jgi:hypothetical protein
MTYLKHAVWLHFLCLGAVLYVGISLNKEPEPLPELPVPSDGEIREMQNNWARGMHDLPDNKEMEELLRDWTDRELLFREALRLNLHLSDTLVWRRLIRNLRFIGKEGSDASLLREAFQIGLHEQDPIVRRRLLQTMEDRVRSGVPLPEESLLRRQYQNRLKHEFTRIRRSFSHVFYSHDRHGRDKARRMAKGFKCSKLIIQNHKADIYPAAPQNVPLSTEQQIAKNFGADFAAEIMNISPNECEGPMDSAYGTHWVYVHEHREEPIAYERARALLLEEWMRAKTDKALTEYAFSLRAHYQVPPISI